MEETYINQDLKVAQLEEELQVYRELLSHLPFSISYEDPGRGILITKGRGKLFPSTGFTEKRNQPSVFKTDFTFEKDIPFEEIEVFLTPIFDTIPHHIVFIDAYGIITLCNQKAANDLRVDRSKVIGRHIRELLKIPDDLIMLLETLRTEQPIVNREVMDANYGINNTRIYRDHNGNIKRVLGAFQFLNFVKEAEKQVVAGRIAAGIAHEIRNPLTTVRGYLQFLTDKFNPEISELVSSLLIPELDRANKIISDFLAIAKPSDTKFEMISINQYISDDLATFLKSEAFLYDVNLEFICSPSVEPCYVSINSSEMLQVFINLFRNAVEAKSTEQLTITMETMLVNGQVQVSFRDNGIGITSDALEHLFDPFFTTKDEGTGLGLSVSRKIIENHGGTISVRSSHKGTTFYIQLPYLLE